MIRSLLMALLAAAIAPPSLAQNRAEDRLARMSTGEKAGQVLMSWILSSTGEGDAAYAKMRAWIEDAGIGGVVLSTGTAPEAKRLISQLQELTDVPLLVAGDFETGTNFRLRDTVNLGCNMLVGAAGERRLARAMGVATAEQAMRLGFHWSFSPVVDVNVNPRNPIINVRSYGEDPQLVARLGAAFIDGLETAGMMATAKHFPGHGDVSSDSHLLMPSVPGDRARLERIELLPFRAAVRAGVSSIMTGHLSVPGLGEDAAVPATLSAKILTGVLRDDMGFAGVIITDALDMGGVAGNLPPDEVAVRALAAGADMLLMPPDPVATRDAIVAAVERGRLPQARLDEAVVRLLRNKQRAGLFGSPSAARFMPPPPVPDADIGAGVAAEIAARGVTLVRDRDGVIPLAAAAKPVLVSVLDNESTDRGATFARELGATRHLRLYPGSSGEDVAAALAALRSAEIPVIALYVHVRSYSGRIGLPEALQPFVSAAAGIDGAIAVSFGNPYLIEDFAEVPAYLCAFNEGGSTETAVAAALRGRAALVGRLPVSIPGVAARGDGLSSFPGTDLPVASPEDEGFSPALTGRIEGLLAAAVEEHVFPGAVALVARRGRVVAEVAFGHETYDPGAPAITAGSRFDLASLTKVCATGPVILRLVARGELALDQRVAELVPEFRGDGKERVTVRHLMAHAAGLPPFIKFFLEMTGRDEVVAAAAAARLAYPPGTASVYSDLGPILLMACAEKAAGIDFGLLAQREVFGPLGMKSATFATTGAPIDAVPTEVCAWRGRLVRGEAHDENAYAMGGVSGHAGLFANARDVARLGVAFLGGGRRWLPRPLATEATRRAGLIEGSSRGLCWDTFVAGGSGGRKLSPESFGHTGFTGTSIWCDPRRDLCLVLLTNRVHPSREHSRIQGIRAAFADLVVGALEESP